MLHLNFERLEDRCLPSGPDYYRDVLCQRPPLEIVDAAPSVTFSTPGWATFGQVLEWGQATDAVRVGDLATQTDVKTRWPDGSIRFATLTVNALQAGTYAIVAAPPPPGSFTPALPPVSAWFRMFDDWWVARPEEGFNWSTDRWLGGPLVVEARQTAAVKHSTTGEVYPNLRVAFDVRCYADGKCRVDYAIENTLDVSAAGMESYEFYVVDGDVAPVYQSIPQHPYLTRWRGTYSRDLTVSQVTPDFESAYRAGALPRYWEGVQNRVSWPTGPDFEPLGKASLNPDMTSHGGRPEIAPYPDWAARYLVHKEPTQRDFVLAHGDLAGSWPIHVHNASGNFLTIDQRPNLWLDQPLWRADRPAGSVWAVGPLQPDNAHQPSLAYIPYIMTGDRYYADEMAFWANYGLLATIPGIRGGNGSEGLLWANETRGFGWALRNLTDAAAYLPDAHPLKGYLNEKLRNNLAWLDGQQEGPLGVAWHRSPFDDGGNPYFDPERRHVWQSASMNNVLAWAVDHANEQGYAGGLTVKGSIARFNVQMLADPLTRDGAAPYFTPIGDRDGDSVTWYTHYSQTYRGPVQYQGYYGVDARLMVLVGLDLGIAGAQAAYAYLNPILMYQQYVEFTSDLGLRAGWAAVRE